MTVNGHRRERTAAVVYGSETGNALEYAEEAGRILERLHFHTVVQPLNALQPVSCQHVQSWHGFEPGGLMRIRFSSLASTSLLQSSQLPVKVICQPMPGYSGRNCYAKDCRLTTCSMSILPLLALETALIPSKSPEWTFGDGIIDKMQIQLGSPEASQATPAARRPGNPRPW